MGALNKLSNMTGGFGAMAAAPFGILPQMAIDKVRGKDDDEKKRRDRMSSPATIAGGSMAGNIYDRLK